MVLIKKAALKERFLRTAFNTVYYVMMFGCLFESDNKHVKKSENQVVESKNAAQLNVL